VLNFNEKIEIKAVKFSETEKMFCQKFYEYLFETDNFSVAYQNLLKNLSNEQQTLLVEIFSRILFVHQADFFTKENFSRAELREQALSKKTITGKIVRNFATFRFDEFEFPLRYLALPLITPEIFYYQLGRKYFNRPEKLQNSDFLDVGAYVGESALFLSRLNPANIFAFEPVTENFYNLQEIIALNKRENLIIPLNIALGEKRGEARIEMRSAASSITFATNSGADHFQQVKLETVDQFVSNNNLRPGLLKIDCEGMGLQVIQGAEETIKRFKPLLIISINHSPEEFFLIKPLLEDWCPDYHFTFVKLNPFSLFYEITLIAECY